MPWSRSSVCWLFVLESRRPEESERCAFGELGLTQQRDSSAQESQQRDKLAQNRLAVA
jgi:hypothetical protein